MEKIGDDANKKKLILVAIGGPSSSGKTTITKNLVKLFTSCKIVHQDDFYKPDDEIPLDPTTNEQNWDHPDAIDFHKLKNFIKKIRKYGSSEVNEKFDTLEPDIKIKLSEEEINHLKKLVDKFENYDLVIVDGFMLFHDEELARLFDLKLFYYADYETLKTRRSKRKGYSTVAGFWVDPPNYFDDYVWPAYEKFHKHLFVDEDVSGELNEYSKSLEIRGYKNSDDSKLADMVEWSIGQLSRYIDSK
ncbi:nicotinamide riboside kinase [[Candida] jaroonii]|uniref:Nicotinamide riboside kinase n=1 Tax=[Candida] jaroonii TaxID=467808 RepID=A0ACA9Y2M6_9ASCO|nr:nicotinamide riboside kinase [[Candida] jaroonii]